MIYTVVRIGVDVVYWVGRLTVDGAYYVIYGHQETQQEKMEKQIHMLENELNKKTMEERKNHKILVKLAEKQGIIIEEQEIDIDSDTVLIN